MDNKNFKNLAELSARFLRGQYSVTDKPLKEDVEELDELSRKTLANYTKKSAADLAGASADQRAASKDKGTTTDPDMKKYYDNKDKKAQKKFVKRMVGIKRATDRLAKEEVDRLDELSRNTLGSYAKKAHKDNAIRRVHLSKKVSERELDKYGNRRQGIDKAIDRLTKRAKD